MAVWARLMYRFRWLVVVAAALSAVPAIAVVVHGGRLETAYLPLTTEAGRGVALLASELPGTPPTFKLILTSATAPVTDPTVQAEIERALAPLRSDPRVRAVRAGADDAPRDRGISRDRHRVAVTVEVAAPAAPFGSREFSALANDVYPALRAKVRSDRLGIVAAGDLPLAHDLTRIAEEDLRWIEAVVLPLVLALLIAVFGSLAAAALPLVVGVLAVLVGVAGTFLLARVLSMSVYAMNVVTMIGLGVAIDYALFVVSRFREEIHGTPVPDALARALATAGRAVLFSGLTVAIGLLGMLLLGLGDLGAIGLAGAMVVALSVVYSLTLLPALLALLGPRINRLRVPFIHPDRVHHRRGFWHSLANGVMRHPWPVLLPVTAALLLLGVPFLYLRLASVGVSALPASAEARRGDALSREQFPGDATTRILAIVSHPDGRPLTPPRIGELYDFGQWLGRLPNVERVVSVVTADPRLDRAASQQLLARPAAELPREIRPLVERTVGTHAVVFAVETARPPSSEEARDIVRVIRAAHPPLTGELVVTGETAFDLDIMRSIAEHAPAAIAVIVLATYLVLFVLLRSVLLPLKAIVMNLLSVTAAYGALVWFFQWGHWSRVLDFTPGPIETVTPIIMFCVLFGLSMDYEVLLLSRAREEYERTGDNTQAVATSLEHTGRLITGAALIMAAVFLGFGAARLVPIKAIGIGIGLAVLMDATIVRALLVPATMRLLGAWNWWSPVFRGRGRDGRARGVGRQGERSRDARRHLAV